MSIFTGTFKPSIAAQIKKREEIRSATIRTPETIQYLNSRNAWIRMTSAVDVDNSDAPAKSYVLLGGTLTNASSQKSGVGSSISNAYSTVSPQGNENRLGIRPMPGITSINVRSKSAFGSLREVVVNFQCWDIRQLEELELLYMRPGYSVLVEWGWKPYINNKTALVNKIAFTDDVINGGSSKEDIWKKIFKKASDDSDGNYDAIYGFIRNFSWSSRPDGGYDCTTTIITMGEIVESLKVNYGVQDTKVLTDVNAGKPGLFPTKVPITPPSTITTSLSSFLAELAVNVGLSNAPGSLLAAVAGFLAPTDNVAEAYSQNIIAGICAELYHIASVRLAGNDVGRYAYVDNQFNNPYYTYNFAKITVKIANQGEGTITDSGVQIYVRLADFVEILNRYVLLGEGNKNGSKPIVKLSVHESDNKGSSSNLLKCLGDLHQISTNPAICLIRNTAYKDPATSLGITVDPSTLKVITDYMDQLGGDDANNTFVPFDYIDGANDSPFGSIGNIYVNLDYLYNLSVNDTLANEDKKEKNDISLINYVKAMMSGINAAIGNLSNFDVFVDPDDSVARIIDVNFLEADRVNAYNKATLIEIHNLKSTVRNYKFESQIFPELSTMVAIGAQVEGGALGTNTETLIDFNKKLTDRIVPRKLAPVSSDVAGITDKIKNLQDSWAILFEYFAELNPDWWDFGAGDYDIEHSSKYANALKDIINFYNTLFKTDAKNRGIIPTKLSLEMDGIGGILIGDMFKISDDFTPKGYKGSNTSVGGKSSNPGARIGYVVTGLSHDVQNNDWTTTIDAQYTVLDEPRGEDKSNLPTVIALNRQIVNGKALTPPVLPPPKSSVNYGFGLPLASPTTFSDIITRAAQKIYNTIVVTGWDPNHEGYDLQGPNGGNKDTARSLTVGGEGTSGDGVFAVQDGVIQDAGTAAGFGWWITVKHTALGSPAKDFLSVYGHVPPISPITNQRLDWIDPSTGANALIGRTVTKGQQIAWVGNEGTSTGYHLHFELWDNMSRSGSPLDPLDYLPYFAGKGGVIPDTTPVKDGDKFNVV